MDDENVVFNTNGQQSPSNTPSQNDPNQKLTMQDLYGPSETQTGEQPVEQPDMEMQPEYVQPPTMTVHNEDEQQMMSSNPPPSGPPDYYQQMPPPATPGMSKGKLLKIILGGILGFIVLILILSIGSKLFNHSGSQAGGAVTITYWGLWEDPKVMQSIISDFEKKNPSIHVTYKQQDKKRYKERLLTQIDNGIGPDVFTFHNSWVPTLTGYLLPLSTDVITPDEFKKEYFPVVQRDLTRNGAIYGLPQGVDTLALFINKDIFDAAGITVPETLEQFNEAAKAVTVRDKEGGTILTAGAALGTYNNITHASDILSMLFVQAGADLNNLDQSVDNLKDAFGYYVPFADSDGVWSDAMDPSIMAFATGKLAMYFGYSWDVFMIEDMSKKSGNDLHFEVHPVPYVPGKEDKRATIASYWVNGVSQKSKHQQESLLFMHYLAQKDVIEKIFTESSKTRLFGMPYARKDLAETLKDNPLVYPFVQQAEYDNTRSTYFSDDTYDSLYNDPLNQYLENAINGVRGGSSPDTEITTLISGVKQIQSKYGL